MMLKILKLIIIAAVLGAAILISTTFRRSYESGRNSEPEISTSISILSPETSQKISTTSVNIIKAVSRKPVLKTSESVTINPVKNKVYEEIKEVSSKSFEELINSSVIQLYCGNLNAEGTTFSDISRGTGIIISGNGNVLTNRHIVYDENTQKIKNNCFILRSPFPNAESQKPKIYYTAEVTDYPLIEKLSDSFSEDKYYNDFAVLKIVSKIGIESKINFLLGFDLAAPTDYLAIENNSFFNFFPIDWNYQPKDSDILITLGYGVDASHLANKITSTIGKISGNININKSAEPQILLIESNATTGFSGGALINPKSKGLVGLVSWITAGDVAGKYTVAIFRDFLRSLMLQDLNLDLKLLQN